LLSPCFSNGWRWEGGGPARFRHGLARPPLVRRQLSGPLLCLWTRNTCTCTTNTCTAAVANSAKRKRTCFELTMQMFSIHFLKLHKFYYSVLFYQNNQTKQFISLYCIRVENLPIALLLFYFLYS
jgi:hypothetical protein